MGFPGDLRGNPAIQALAAKSPGKHPAGVPVSLLAKV
jgi:hypothetical protein